MKTLINLTSKLGRLLINMHGSVHDTAENVEQMSVIVKSFPGKKLTYVCSRSYFCSRLNAATSFAQLTMGLDPFDLLSSVASFDVGSMLFL